MNLFLKGGRLIDPSSKTDGNGDLLIENGKIVRTGKMLQRSK
jgi:predicted amidohydrolase